VTSVLGAILLAGYMGGAICTHWRVATLSLPRSASASSSGWPLAAEGRLKSLIPLRTSQKRHSDALHRPRHRRCGRRLVLIILILAATKPDTFRVERITTIAAPAEKAFGILSDFHQWGAWSPWEKLDPAMTKTYSGAEKGKGAITAWKGNNKVGKAGWRSWRPSRRPSW